MYFMRNTDYNADVGFRKYETKGKFAVYLFINFQLGDGTCV